MNPVFLLINTWSVTIRHQYGCNMACEQHMFSGRFLNYEILEIKSFV